MIKKIHVVGISLGVVVVALAWWLSGAPILERGTWAVACYITVFVSGFIGSIMADLILTDRAEKSPTTQDGGADDSMGGPVNRIRYDLGQAQLVEKTVVGLRVANERIADLEKRLSSLSLVAGIRPANRAIQDLKK